MGIQNKDGALYFATGIDNSGLYSGRNEAMGIIKAMASEITAFDVFGGIGISAGIAFAQAAKGAYEFEKQFQQSMKEVATLSSGIKGSLTDYMNQVMEITREIPVLANDAAKALYQIVSAGHDGANGMKVLEVSAKAAIGGVTDTATAADGITTLLNAYKLDVSEAEKISDQLFTTVKLGKTSFGELGKSIAQVAPIAASYGVETDQVLAAVATLTKQGTPTAQAMTQIRASIIAVSKVLGDGAFDNRTYQEALAEVARQAGGSESELRELVPEVEAVNAVLGLTGINVKEAAGHLEEMQNATGAAEAAFKEMASSAENQMKLLGNNITAALRPMGEAILKEISSIATAFNNAFENGNAQEAMKTLGTLIVTLTSAFVGYKGSIIAINAIKKIHISLLEMEKYEMLLYRKAVEAGTISENALTAAQVKQMATRRAMVTTIKLHTATLLKNAAAMLANPYVLAAAAAAALGYAIYKVVTAETEAERVQKRYNKLIEEQTRQLDELKSKTNSLVSVIQDENSTQYDKVKAYKQLQALMPTIFSNMDIETLKLMDHLSLNKQINNEINRRERIGAKTNLVLAQNELNSINSRLNKATKEQAESPSAQKAAVIQKIQEEKKIAEEELKVAQKRVDDILNIQKEAKEKAKPKELKIISLRSNIDTLKSEITELKSLVEKEQEENNGWSPNAWLLDAKQHQLSKKEKELKALQGSGASKKVEIKTDKAFWTKQKDDATKALDSIASSQKKQMDAGKFKGIDSAVVTAYKENVKKLKEAEKELKVYDSSSKQDDQAHKLREEQEKYKLLLDKQNREQQRMKEDSANELEQLEINKLKESSEKVLKQRELNHKLELQAIEREAEDKKLKVIEDARSAFDANPDNKGKSFNVDKFVKSEPVKKQFDAFDKIADAKTKTENTKYNRGDDLKELLDKYQNFNRRRLNLEKEYQEDEKILQDRMLKAKTEDEKNEIQELMDELVKRRKKGIQEISKDEIEDSGIWKQLMGDVDALPTEELEKLLSDAEQLVNVTNLSTTDIKAMMNTINNARQNLISRNPFKTLKEEYEKYQKAIKKGDKQGASTSWSNVEQASESIKNNISILGTALSSLGNTFSSELGDGIQKAVDVISDGITAFEVFGKTGEKSAGDTVKGISGIIGIITTLVGTVMNAFDSTKAEQERNIEYQRRQEGYWDSINYQVERYLELLKEATANDYFEIAGKSLTTLEEARKKAYEDIVKSMPVGDVDSTTFGLFQLLYYGKFSNKLTEQSFGGPQAKEIFDFINANGGYDLENKLISEEAIWAMKNNAGIWSKLPEWMQQAIDKFIELNDQAKELEGTLNEDLFQATSKSIEEAILEGLKGGKRGIADFGEDFEEIMRNSLLQSFVIDQLRGKAQEFYKKYTLLADNDKDGKLDLTAEEIKDLRTDWNDIIKAATEEAKNIDSIIGSSSSSQESTKKGFAAASQDSIDELNGRFTALQIAGETSKEQLVIQTGIQQIMAQRLELIYNFNYSSMTEMRDIIFDVMDILSDMKKDTAHLYFIRESLNKIESNTKGLISR
ncbi:phage tail tape measure protein [uncultured Bacteroides sp.]|uniref:phage tail tape measure protein n=1 Tax=uncultured Bacteroides sp. TaxID=162156 RepID=UPI0027DBDE1E|nr:phage tail tape measure protein [uncultured Bacteroides sp.]